jgi:hypothetical protein
MRDSDAPWASYATYGWSPAPGVDGNDRSLLMLDQNIRRAIAGELQRRGYTESANPDLRITYQTTSKDVVESNPVRVGVGMGSWGGSFGGSVSVGSPEAAAVTTAVQAAMRDFPERGQGIGDRG